MPSFGDSYAMRVGKARGRCAALLRQAIGRGECAPAEPVAESALQRPRTAHPQLAGANRAAELGPSQAFHHNKNIQPG